MNSAHLVKHALLILAGCLVLFWALYLMVTPLALPLGVVLFLVTVVVGELLLSNDNEKRVDESPSKSSKPAEFAILAVFALSLMLIALVPAIRGEVFVEWSALEMSNIVRLIAAFGMNFMPGYLALTICGSHTLGRLAKVIASYFLSLFILTLVAFVSARIVGVVNDLFLNVFVIVCCSLIVVFLLKSLLRKKNLGHGSTSTPSATRFRGVLPALLVGLTVAFIAVWFWWMYSRIGFFIGTQGTDMWRIHSTAQDYLDFRAFNLLQFPWWLNLYLAGFAVLSGAPLANAYVTLFPIIALSVLSFYVMASAFFKDKKIASIATLSYGIFSGPAWLYALYLRDFSSTISYDAWKTVLYEASDKFLLQGRYPPFVVGLNGAVIAYASLWWLMYATWQLDLKRKFNLLLMGITFALSYMIHGVDPIIFQIYLIALLVVSLATGNNEGKDRVKRASLSSLLGIGIVTMIDVSLTSEYDYFNSVSIYALSSRYYYFNSPSFYILVLSSLSIIIFAQGKLIGDKLRRIGHFMFKRVSAGRVDSLRRRLPEAVLYLYGLSLVVFIVLFPSLSPETTLLGNVPWYVYLIEGGVPTLLGLVGVTIALNKWDKLEIGIRDTVVFCMLSVLFLFVFGQAVSFINERFFYTRFWERRTFAYIHPIMSLLMAYALVALFGDVHVEKPKSFRNWGKIGAVSLLTSLIVLSSVSSSLIAGDFAQSGYFTGLPTEEELEALKFLHYSLPKGARTAYIAQRTGTDFIRAFSSDKWSYDQNLWLGQYSYSPSSIIYAIRYLDIQYLYFNRIRDAQDLNKNLFLRQLIKVLPVAFNNSDVTIYSFPPLQAPSRFSSLAVVTPKETTGSIYDAYVLWFWTLVMSELPYSVARNTSDIEALDFADTVIMPYDPLRIREDSGELLDWVSNGGHLVVSNTNEFGMFAEIAGLKKSIQLVSCDSTENWTAAYKRGIISVENSTKVEGIASLRLQNNLSAWEGWIYQPSTPWNLTQYEYIGIWVYGTGGGPIWYLYLTDSDGNSIFYRYDLSVYDSKTKTMIPSFTGWKLILVPLKEVYGQLNLSAIARLHIDTGWTLPVNILIDDIFVVEETQERLWVQTNGFEGQGQNTSLPLFEVESLGFNLDAQVTANYTMDGVPVTPFALQESIGNGKVTYLNANLLYDLILSGSSELRSPYEILLNILKMIGVKET